ncbi:Gypsy retrotransposon integrase-like protein 1 [Marasmius crinis-equi]|uniref:Gypsy retrotransposon integrase-like protein 1 n=1 Tax=Marasmius crinis-equi TaxID=585013 RepID=A0ABR3F1I5_9AGAR
MDNVEAALHKKRRLQGSCDACKKRKVKCRDGHVLSELKETDPQLQGDSKTMPGNVCSNCISLEIECTHVMAMSGKKRGPPKGTPRGQKTLKSLVRSILSTTKPYEIPEDTKSVREILVDLAQRIVTLEKALEETTRAQFQLAPRTPSTPSTVCPAPQSSTRASVSSPSSPVDADDPVADLVSDFVKQLQLDHNETRHFGGVKLVTNVLGEVLDAKPASAATPRTPQRRTMTRRPEFWKAHSWQIGNQDPDPHYIFPPDDLMWNLFDLYFTEIHPYSPVLHQGIFRKAVSNGLHHRDHHFAAVVLVVCASASRHSNDPRVFEDNSRFALSAGWKWFRQIRLIRSNFASPPSVYELQLYCIATFFLQKTSTPEVCWVMLGVGVRLAQDLGIHRKPPTDSKPTIESQLWNRAFWCLVVIDVVGNPDRAPCISYDLPLPIDCDDEYWEVEDPERAFKQPEGRPSSMSYWIAFLKLMDIVGFAQRTIYAVRKTDMVTRMGMSGPEWNERIVSEIDVALSAWVDSVPDHLKWTPNKPSKQSIILHATYYWVQMVVHRPFLNLSPRTGLRFSSLTICANAARSVIHIVEVDSSVTGFPTVLIILFLKAWRGRHNGKSERELGDVHKCLEMTRRYESTSQVAGRCCDILKELLLICNASPHPPSSSPSPSLKRSNTQIHDDSAEAEEESNGGFRTHAKPPRQIAGAKRVSQLDFSLPTGTSPSLHETFPVRPSVGLRPDDAVELDLFAQFAGENVGVDTSPVQESTYISRTMAESLSSAFGNMGGFRSFGVPVREGFLNSFSLNLKVLRYSSVGKGNRRMV